ncbi:HlyD family secretion protein [Burkholderia plantarii]|uniref:Secretion protein, HlyD family n=1 Tax=Burkholderia plantarii TaxID=41899 RepID=A0A0B6S5L3_BURPL|nr:HlyD family secretion protein [Burkholderia plantarii]AJK49709.1 secretion protein, HlyD family [Burkholderia plantarii]ALK33927.1 HlyD family secretion protein [Burkholderia plantarii]GLZ19617.1 multidrug resistance efflux pump [Burkholderia plantarii]
MSTTAVPEKTARLTKRHWIVAGAVIGVVALALFGWRWWTVGRFIQSTDDAYVRADIVTVSPRVSGYVTRVAVDDDQPVHRGDVLVRLDDRDYRAKVADAQAAVDAAEATLAAEQAAAATLDAQVGQQHSVIAQARADVDAARVEATRRDTDAARYKALLAESAASDQRWEQAHAEAMTARAQLARAGAALQAQTDQETVLRRRREQSTAVIGQARARVEAARAKLELAGLDLEHTVIRATRDGSVGQRSVRAGQYVEAGLPLLAVVPLDDVYVVANFKETQLGAMRDGQPVEIDVDTYSSHTLHGRVLGLSPGSGAEFALLPPDNATGNFTKIVQRLPVKIRLDATPADVVLRPGMSVIARVDTHPRQGAGS